MNKEKMCVSLLWKS